MGTNVFGAKEKLEAELNENKAERVLCPTSIFCIEIRLPTVTVEKCDGTVLCSDRPCGCLTQSEQEEGSETKDREKQETMTMGRTNIPRNSVHTNTNK